MQSFTESAEMTTTELIAKLQQLEAEHGALNVYLEATATGINLADEGGNVFERYTISPLVEKCEVDRMGDGATKVAWLIGNVAADEPEPDDEDTSLDNVGAP
jgi:hypothetical protein